MVVTVAHFLCAEGDRLTILKKGRPKPPPYDWVHQLHCYIGQIFQITPVPGIWTSGPLAAPTKCVSALLSRTAP